MVNPVDLTFAAGPDSYRVALTEVLADGGVDAVIVVYAPPAAARRAEVGAAIVEALDAMAGDGRARSAVPVLATFLGAATDAPLGGDGGSRIPLFEFPSSAARVLGTLATYGDWLAQPAGELPPFDPDELEPARARIAELLDGLDDRAGGAWLGLDDAAGLLELCGLAMVPYRQVWSADDAVAAAAELGDSVVLKATGLPRLSKSEAGGVALDVHGAEEVRAAYGRMSALLGAAMVPAVVQCMAAAGVDARVAAHQQPSYGGVISLGLGGSVAKANPRRSVRVLPLTDADARRLVDDSPLVPLLADQSPSLDARLDGGLLELLLRLAWVVEQLPELADVELDPVLAAGDRVAITAARVRVAPAVWEPEPDVRRLH